ncbi:MAG: hypothetical protein N3G74_00350 [Candidatus Micrarchaeota archaeon]|nr:hypothetical protein [Candidatus Micrarchaeota archaeon]
MVHLIKLYKAALDTKISRRQLSKAYDNWNEESTVFMANGKTLVFLGSKHEVGERDIEFIKRALDIVKPQLVLLERPANSEIKEILSLLSKPSFKWSDREWLIKFANEKAIPMRGMDIEDRFSPFLNLKGIGINRKEGLAAGFLVYALTYMGEFISTEKRALSDEDIFDLATFEVIRNFGLSTSKFKKYRPLLLQFRKKGSLFISTKQMLAKAAKTYISKDFLTDIVNDYSNVISPYPFANKYKINKIKAWWDAHRNKTMIESCINALKENDTVLAMAGWGHIAVSNNELKKEIERKFGKTDVYSWKDFFR